MGLGFRMQVYAYVYVYVCMCKYACFYTYGIYMYANLIYDFDRLKAARADSGLYLIMIGATITITVNSTHANKDNNSSEKYI